MLKAFYQSQVRYLESFLFKILDARSTLMENQPLVSQILLVRIENLLCLLPALINEVAIANRLNTEVVMIIGVN